MSTPQQQLDAFIDEFTPEIAKLARQVLKKLNKRLPGAKQLVYDNYNALAIGFSPTEKAGDVIFSVALYPRWINFFFYQSGAKLPNPNGTLKGSGGQVRHIRLTSARDLDDAEIKDLMQMSLDMAKVPLPKKLVGEGVIIRSISAKQRSRRPAGQS